MALIATTDGDGNENAGHRRRRDGQDGTGEITRDVIASWLAVLTNGFEGCVEMRALGVTRHNSSSSHVESSFYDPSDPSNLRAMARDALNLSPRSSGIYLTLNPVHASLFHANLNSRPTSDADILGRRWLLIDCDPTRPSDSSATDPEKAEAFETTKAVRNHLRSEAWPEPILADSGNGYHLFYRVNLANDDSSKALIKFCLRALAARFDSSQVTIDKKVFNAGRIVKLPGTLSRKGEDSAERPHRMSRVIDLPTTITAVWPEQLEVLAAEARQATTEIVIPLNGAAPHTNAPQTNGLIARSIDPTDTVARAVAYLETCDPAISGQGGHSQTFKIAVKIGPGFDLPPETALHLLLTHYNPRCQPLWSEAELRHKVEDAYKNSPTRGFLAEASTTNDGHAVAPTASQSVSPWETPSLETLAPSEPMPIGVFPDAILQFIYEGAACLACPRDFLGLAVLAIAGTAIGRSLAISIKDSWSESASIYAAFVGKPGSTKSPALSLVAKPLWEITDDLLRQYHQDLERFEESADEEAARPVLKRIAVSDTTCEALAPILSENPRGVIMVRDELTAWISGLNQYKSGGKGSDRQFFLSAWSGSPVIVDRKHQDKGPIHIPHPFLGVLGALTPDMLSELIEEEGRDDGFLDRLLFCFPDPVRVRWQPDGISIDTANSWSTAVMRLWARNMILEDERHRPFFVRFTPEALAIFATWYDDHNLETEQADFPQSLDGAWSKLRGYCARLALILDQLDLACDPTSDMINRDVGRRSIEGAITLTDYFKDQCRRIRLHLVGSRDNNDAKAILHWLYTRVTRDQITTISERDIRKNFPRRFPTGENHALEAAVEWLKRRHFLRSAPRREEQSKRPGRPATPTYEVNPRLVGALDSHGLNAEVAEHVTR